MAPDALIDLVLREGAQAIYPILLFTLLRPLGLVFGFVAFTWAVGRARVLRMSIATGLGLPTLAVHADQLAAVVAIEATASLALLAGKEFLIGYAMGFLASLPFFALQFAGAITDAFRGETDSGLIDPMGGTLQTSALLYVLIGLSVFAAAGGLWGLVTILYGSYDVWTLTAPLPRLDAGALGIAMDAFGAMLLLTVRTALPLLALLLAIEFVAAVAARLAKKFGLQDLTFTAKNLVTILMLPVIAWFVLRVAEPATAQVETALAVLALLFGLTPP